MDDFNKNEFFESKMTDDKATTAADANDALLDEIDEFDDDEYEIVLEEIFDDDVAPAEQPTAQESETTPIAESAEETAPAKEEQAPAEEKPAEAHPAVTHNVDLDHFASAQDNLSNADFTIQEPAQAPAPKPKKKKAADPWAVAPIVAADSAENAPKAEEEQKKAPAKKTSAKKAETPVAEEAPAKKAQPKQAAKAEPTPEPTAKKAAQTKTAKTEKAETPAKKPAKRSNTAETAETIQNNKKVTAKKEEKKVVKEIEEEKVLIAGDDSLPQHGKFVIKKTDNGNFVYKLYSSNKRVLAVPGGAYKDMTACKGGIQSVINNAATAPIEDQTLKNPVVQKCPKWEIYFDKKNEVRLRLVASNGNVVAITNDGYTTKDSAKKGIDAIARAAAGASVVRNDDLW